MKLVKVLAAAALAITASSCGVGERTTVVAEFADVGDLVGRANVQQSDAVIGTVRSIDLIQRGDLWLARVEMRVDPETNLTSGTTAVVRSTSLLGEKYVDLVPASDSSGPRLRDGAVIPATRTRKAPELEALFSHLGALLQSGGLEDLARITTASAAILEGQEEHVGRVLDGTAKLIATIRSQKDALASGIADLSSAAKTLNERSSTIVRALDVSDDALRIVAAQQRPLDELVVQLDKLGAPLAELMRAHKADIDSQLKSLNTVVPKLYQVRSTLEHAVEELPRFTKLFARAAPGDYVQLDVFAEALPIGTPLSNALDMRDILLELTL